MGVLRSSLLDHWCDLTGVFRSYFLDRGSLHYSCFIPFQLASRTLACSPLRTYTFAGDHKPKKVLVGPAGTAGRVVSFNIHDGILDSDHQSDKSDHQSDKSDHDRYRLRAKTGCAFVLHAANLWTGRFPLGSFSQKKGSKRMWGAILPPLGGEDSGAGAALRGGGRRSSASEYVSQCLVPPYLDSVVRDSGR